MTDDTDTDTDSGPDPGQPDPYSRYFQQQPPAAVPSYPTPPPGYQQPQQQSSFGQPPIYGQPPTQQFPAQRPQPPKQRNWLVRHKVWSAVIGVVALIAIFGIIGSLGQPPSKPASNNAGAAVSAPAATTPSAAASTTTQPAASSQTTQPAVSHTTSAPAPAQTTQAPPPPPQMTASQQSAIQDAQSYLSTEPGFSYQGLINQVEYDQFSAADATFAVNDIAPASDTSFWNTQAADDAHNYMTTEGGFSCGSLLQQLEYDQFTQAEAEYGTNSVGLGIC